MSFNLSIALANSPGYIINSPHLSHFKYRVILASFYLYTCIFQSLYIDPSYALDSYKFFEIIQYLYLIEISLAIFFNHKHTITNKTPVNRYADWKKIFFMLLRHTCPIQINTVSIF